MNKCRIWIILVLPLSLFLTRCDPGLGYEFYVNNKSDSLIIVDFKGQGSVASQNDSIVLIEPDTTKLFFKTGILGSNPQDEGEKFLKLVDTISVFFKSGEPIKINYYKRENWSYSKEIKYFGLIKTGINKYTLELNNDNIK